MSATAAEVADAELDRGQFLLDENDERIPVQLGRLIRRWSGASGTRTRDLLGAIQALSQLSYSPMDICLRRQTG
jgi:hypothetical protein